jgi:hypothetical protein
MMVVQEKTQSYVERTLGDDFVPLAIKTYRCFHFHFDSFLVVYAQTHYCVPLAVFFSPLDVHFLLLIACIHNLVACVSHNDSSMNCYIWSRFFIFSTHHSYCASIISWFVADDYFFILSLLCYRWLSFCSLGSYLHKVSFHYFSLIVYFCLFSLGCVYLCFHLPCTFDGWVLILDFYTHGFPFQVNQQSRKRLD